MNGIHSTVVKRHPEFVYSKGANACLVHRIREVRAHWYDGKLSHVSIETICGQIKFSRLSVMCAIARPEATDCGRCYGQSPTFRGRAVTPERKAAHAQLGCVMEAVNG